MAKVKSMTGFGKSTVSTPYGDIVTEIKTLNHKSLSISCAPFEDFFLLEEKMQAVFAARVLRGRAFVRITREHTEAEKPLRKMVFNEKLAREYLKKTRAMQEKLSLKGQLEIRDILSLPGIMEKGTDNSEEKLWPYIKKGVAKALDELVKYREEEGARLAKDVGKRIAAIAKAIAQIKKYSAQTVSNYRKKLSLACKEIAAKGKVDEGKVEEEVAAFAKGADVSEEITRLEHHIASCVDTLKMRKADDIGKKLDFIAQEMHREANTIGSKAEDYRISRAVIDVKSEIEKIREQVKNIE